MPRGLKPDGTPMDHAFKPGQSGNPGGRPKDKTLRQLAREHTVEAVQTLIEIMLDKSSSEMARVRAAEAILDRGYGKPVQAIEAAVEGQTYAVFVPVPIEDVSEWERMSAGLLSGPRNPALN